jgi:hypothetical protein
MVVRLLPMAISNVALFHAMLCIAAAHFNLYSKQDTFNQHSAYHRNQSIHLLQTVLEDKDNSCSDQTVSTVLLLADYDVSYTTITLLICLDSVREHRGVEMSLGRAGSNDLSTRRT